MYRPIRALLWEQWRLLRWPIMATVLLSFSLVAIPALSMVLFPLTPGEFVIAVFILLGFIVLLLSCFAGKPEGKTPVFPSTLPLRTYKFTAVRFFTQIIIPGTFLLIILSLLQSADSISATDLEPVSYAPLSTTLMFVAFFSAFHAIFSWPKFERNFLMGILYLLFLFYREPIIALFTQATKSWAMAGLLGGITILLFFLLSVLGDSKQRHNHSPLAMKTFGHSFLHPRRLFSRGRPHLTRDRAQVWFEWNIFGKAFLLTPLIYFMLFLYLYVPFYVHLLQTHNYSSSDLLRNILLSKFIWVAAYSSFLVGNIVTQSFSRQSAPLNTPINMALPAHTAMLSKARLKTGLYGISISLVTTLLVYVTYFCFYNGSYSSFTQYFFQSDQWSEALISYGCMAVLAALGAWTMLWFGFVICGVFLLSIVFSGISTILDIFCHSNTSSIMTSLYYLLVAFGILVGVFLLFRWASKNRLAHSRTLYILATMCLLMPAASGLFLTSSLVWPLPIADYVAISGLDTFYNWTKLLFWMSIAILPVLPFLTVPFTIQHIRHR